VSSLEPIKSGSFCGIGDLETLYCAELNRKVVEDVFHGD
jgi:hypothetical protein